MRRNAVGRRFHHAVALGLQCGCEGLQRGAGKQRPHIGRNPALAQTLDQRHRYQRMPAQLEEVIVAADPLYLQQLGPQFR